jgi:hypothetical protein
VELYNAAGADWQQQIEGPVCAAFALAALEGPRVIADRVRLGGDGAVEVQRYAAETRIRILTEIDANGVVPIAERALARLLMPAADPRAFEPPHDAARATGDWGRQYLAEVMRQLALHLTARDVVAQVGSVHETANGARRRCREVASKAAAVALAGTVRIDPESLPGSWSSAVAETFRRGRTATG